MNRALFSTCASVCILAACSGGRIDSASTQNGSPTESSEGGGVPSDSGSACQAACSTPSGAVETTTSLAQAYAQLAGRWLICTGKESFSGAPADTIGLEFAPAVVGDASCGFTGGAGNCGGGQFYYLVQGPNGPVRGAGFQYELTYDVSQEGPTSFQLNIHPAPNSGFGGSFRYSPCPRELELPSFNYARVPPVLVAVDVTSTR